MDTSPHSDSPLPTDRKLLRRIMRQRRRSLTPTQQAHAARQLKQHLRNDPLFWRARSIALYLANDGEIDPRELVELIWTLRKRCYLPVLHPVLENQLWFYEYTPDTQLRQNRFRIWEPEIRQQQRRPAWTMSLVLFPLVAFDNEGGRLGMGGGFYDRTFAFTRRRKPLRPRLVGLAHDFQRVDSLDKQPWDIPLDAVATDRKIYRFDTRREADQPVI